MLVPKTERVIKRSKVIERTPTEYRQCFATYTTTTGGPRTDGRPGYVQNYMKSGENCVSTSSYREDEVEVESVEYKSHTETETRQRSAELTTRTRRTTLAYAIAARVRIEADEHAIALDDKVEYDEVEYEPAGRGGDVRSVGAERPRPAVRGAEPCGSRGADPSKRAAKPGHGAPCRARSGAREKRAA